MLSDGRGSEKKENQKKGNSLGGSKTHPQNFLYLLILLLLTLPLPSENIHSEIVDSFYYYPFVLKTQKKNEGAQILH